MKNLVAFVVFIVICGGVASSFYCVGEGETVLVNRFGRVVSVVDRPGLHFKWPVLTSTLRFDRRYQALGTLATRIQTADSTEVNAEYLVIGQIDQPQRFFRATGGDSRLAVAQLTPILTETLRARLRAWTLAQLIADQSSSLTPEQRSNLNQALYQLGVRVIDVRLKQINFPADSQQLAAVYQRMRSQRIEEASALRADGDEQSMIIRAKADNTATVLVANAQRDAQRINGQAEAEVAQIYARSAAVDPTFYAFYRGLEAFRTAMSPGNAVFILRNDDAFLRGLLQDH